MVSETEIRPADRWVEANQRKSEAKNREGYVPGGIKERRDQLKEAVIRASERRRLRRDRLICPECAQTYSRGYIARHRKDFHGVQNPSSVHQGYASSLQEKPRPRRVLCPECDAPFPGSRIAPHRRAEHGVIPRRGGPRWSYRRAP